MRFIDLQEGPNDPGIFKAIFLAGGPGSGKGYVAQQLGLQARGLKVVNSDDAFEYLMRKRKLSFEMPPEEQPDRDVARQRAKDLTNKRQDIYLDGRLGIIIDGTAKDPNKMAKLKAELEAIGYQTMMVFVNTSLRTALQRNLLRDRKVPTDIVTQSHKQVQTNKDTLSNVFAPNYVEVNNDDNANFNEPLKRVEKFIDAPVTSQARDWISKASVQKSIAQEDVQSKPKVYVDMDGVLANFYAGVTRVTGHEEPRDMALQDIEDTMASFKGTDFFYRLPKYEQTDQLIAMVNAATKGDWYILSSPLKYDREGSAKYKAAWIRDKLKIQPKDMYFQSDKAQFATQSDGTPNILIDDYPKYLNSWKEKNGIGVQYKGHVGNIEDVKATLDKYLGAGVEETIRKVQGGYRLLSKKGKNLGTYPSKAGAEKRERQVQYFKHMGEQGRSTAVEPHEPGYQHSLLTAPQNTLVIDKSDDMDFYKLGQHYTSLANYDKHELGVGPSDMTITFASPEEMERMKKVFDKLGVVYKDISGSHEEPEIHTKPPEGKVAEALDSSYPYEFKNNAYYFITDAGNDYKAVFKGDKKVEVSFMARGENNQPKDDITGTGDSRKVFGTVVNIVKDYVGQHQPEILMFAADNNEPSRIKLYNMLAAQAGKSLPGYNFVKKLKGSLFTTFYLTRDNVKVPKLDTAKNLAGRALDKVFDSQQPKIHTSKIGETILTEEQLVEGFLDSAKAYLGNSYTKTVADIKSNVVDLKQAGIVIKDVLTDPQQTAIVNAQLGKQINMLVKQMSTAPNAATTPMIKFIQQNILPVVRVDGIKGFLGRLGVYGVLKYVSTQLTKITDVVKDQLLGLMADVVKQVSSTALTMSSYMGIFDNLSTIKKYFLDVLSYIKSKLMSVQVSRPTETVQIDELADKPYSYSQNVKTPDKRAYRFQTDAGQLYRVQVFNRRKDDANKLEIHFDLTNMKTGQPNSGVTGTGDAVRVFSTVANILQQEVADQDPTGIIIASKADDESRVKLYRTLARRAVKTMSGFEISGERTVTGGDGNPYITIELTKQ
jgi:predicted kinase